MLAKTHALSGAVVWLALSSVLEPGPSGLVLGTAVAAGAALLPDLDHPNASAAKVWGPYSRALCAVICSVSGGHRVGTHTLLAALVAGVGSMLALGWFPAAVAVVALCAGLAALAVSTVVTVRWARRWWINLAVSALAGLVVVVSQMPIGWLPGAVFVGYLAHLAGDFVTDGGVPLLLPFGRRRYRLTRLNTGGAWETGVALVLTAALFPLGWMAIGA